MADQETGEFEELGDPADIPITLSFEAREAGDPAEKSAPVTCSAMSLMTVYKAMLAGVGHDGHSPLRVTMKIGGEDVTMEGEDALELLAKLQHYILTWGKRHRR